MALPTSVQKLYSSKIWRVNMLHCRNFSRNTYCVPSIISGSIRSGILAAKLIKKNLIPTTGGSVDLDADVYRSIQLLNTLVYYNECIPTSRACAETDNKNIEMASLLTHFEMQSVMILNGTL